ncbi:MAG TPA: hypothetical protein VGW57_03190 [Chthoniobacterales bacterium]|nr:hypothetical protein [Chthoniobacterales bacterium]
MRKRATRANGTALVFALIAIVAWLSLSNHCALGLTLPAPEPAESIEGGCPMHRAPVKKKPAVNLPCCKHVRAVLAKGVAAVTPGLQLIGSRPYATATFPPARRLAFAIENLDTGPPGCSSFAESVLQESMFSHAPPLS